MDIRSSNILRSNNSENKILLDSKFQKRMENITTELQSNLHYNKAIKIHLNISIMDTPALEVNKMEKKINYIKPEVSNPIT
jgi:hypothetical protein